MLMPIYRTRRREFPDPSIAMFFLLSQWNNRAGHPKLQVMQSFYSTLRGDWMENPPRVNSIQQHFLLHRKITLDRSMLLKALATLENAYIGHFQSRDKYFLD